MITGAVNAHDEALIRLPVQDRDGKLHDLDVVVDTGFNGSMTLPATLISKLKLPWRTRGKAILANGQVDEFDIHAAVVIWDGSPRKILIEAVDAGALIGMALLRDHELRVKVINGGLVSIAAMP